jgi:hypothetical protein
LVGGQQWESESCPWTRATHRGHQRFHDQVIELTHFEAAARQIRFAIPQAMTPASLKLKYPQRPGGKNFMETGYHDKYDE